MFIGTAQLTDKSPMLVDKIDTFEQRYYAGCNSSVLRGSLFKENEAGKDEIS